MIQFSACKILQVSYEVFEALSKTAPTIVHYKARPPHTAIFDSLGPLARPPPPPLQSLNLQLTQRRGRRPG